MNRQTESKGKGLRVKRALRTIIMDRDKQTCLCCGQDYDLYVDFIIPRTFDGSSIEPDNLQTLCFWCKENKQGRIRDYLNIKA